jgi:GAF domain-containing protein
VWSQIFSGQTVSFEMPGQMPREAESERLLFETLGIKSLFCPPLRFTESVLGACGFATLRENRRWPERQVRDLTMLAEVVACAAARSQAYRDILSRETALSEQLQFQRFVAEISSTFLTVSETDIDHHVNLAFRRIAEAFGLDRVSLWWFDADGESSSFSHSWIAAGVPPPRTILGADVPWIRSRVRSGELVAIEHAGEFPAPAAAEREYFSKTQIQSLLLIPHATGRSGPAASVFSTVRRRREWNPAVIEQLRFLGDVVVSAVVRGRADHALMQRDEELAQAQRIAPGGS